MTAAELNPSFTSAVLTALSLAVTYLSVILVRRGKREDVKQAGEAQDFLELRTLTETRASEIGRLIAERDAARAEVLRERAEHDRQREVWEARWARQMERCRRVTEPLVVALRTAMSNPGRAGIQVEDAIRTLRDHNSTDHDDTQGG